VHGDPVHLSASASALVLEGAHGTEPGEQNGLAAATTQCAYAGVLDFDPVAAEDPSASTDFWPYPIEQFGYDMARLTQSRCGLDLTEALTALQSVKAER
jgi:hypothetical protein